MIPTYFWLYGDCVLFRGLREKEKWDEWDRPWFDRYVGKLVADYLSGSRLRIVWAEGTYCLWRNGTVEKFRSVEVDGELFYEFGGPWTWEMR